MPTTPDRPDGRSAGSDDPFAAAEAESPAARETVRVDRAPARPAAADGAAVDRPAADRARRTEVVDSAAVNARRETVRIGQHELGHRATVKLPNQRRSVDQAGRAPLIVAAAFATLWAAILSVVPIAAVIGLARTLEGAGGLGGATMAGLAGWLLGHGVPIETPIGPLALAPLLVTLLAAWRLDRAGLHVIRAIGARHTGSVRSALLVAVMVGFWYAVLGALAALIVDGPGSQVSAGRALLNYFVLGFLAALVGALRSTDSLVVLARRMPRVLRHGLRTGLISALFILAAGALGTGLSVAIGAGQAADMIHAYRTGVAGQAGITLLSLAYGANAAVWAAAYLLGPGFLLGAGSAIRLTEVSVGPLPTLPLLAGLPNGPMGATGTVLLAVPILAGGAAGWLLARRLMRSRPAQPGAPVPPRREPPWPVVVGSSLLAGPVAGVVLGMLAWMSGGSLGDGRMSVIGPDPWQIGLVAAAVVAVSASIGAALCRAFRAPRRS
jgi:Family of unknown function (DUF6350)